jgi:large subunit ribosomal protein L7/L12
MKMEVINNMAAISKEEFIAYISNMTVIELSELVKELENKFGVSAAAPVAVAAGASAPQAQEAEAEKTEFNVVITSSGDKKIQVIKVVRAVTGLGLKEAKAVVDGIPGTVKEAVPKEEAENIKGQLEEAGATVEIK